MFDVAQTSSVISLVRRRNINLSTIGIGQKSDKFSEISKLDVSGVHFILSRSVRLLNSMETQARFLETSRINYLQKIGCLNVNLTHWFSTRHF